MSRALMLIITLLLSCQKSVQVQDNGTGSFEIFLLMGQSNTESGEGLIPGIDKDSKGIMQLGRHGANYMKVIAAEEPLENWDPRPSRIGFALAFAKLYKDSLMKPGTRILIIPCGMGNSGFASQQWNVGDSLYNDAVFRVNFILRHFPGSRLKAVLWQHGEFDVANPGYRSQLDNMLLSLRKDIKDPGHMTPILAGGMVPYWVRQDSARIRQQDIIRNLPSRITASAYADPEYPMLISKPNDSVDDVHYDANGQRELARRYFAAYKKLVR